MTEKLLNGLIESYPKLLDAAWGLLVLSVVVIAAMTATIVVRKKEFSVKGPVIVSVVSAGGFVLFTFVRTMLPRLLKGDGLSWIDALLLFGIFMGGFIVSTVLFRKVASFVRGNYRENVKADSLVLGVKNLWDGKPTVNPQFFSMTKESLYTNLHVVGGIGSGKTTTIVYPALQQVLLDTRPAQKPSVFLVDVKGGVIDDVLRWEHRRKKDIVVLGYGHQKVNLLGADDPLLVANNLNTSFAGFKGDRVDQFYKNYQETFLRNTISFLFSFTRRPPAFDEAFLSHPLFEKPVEELSEKDKRLRQLSESPIFKKRTVTLHEVFSFIVDEDFRRALIGYYNELKGRKIPADPSVLTLLDYFGSTRDNSMSYLSGLISDLNTLMTDKIKEYFCAEESFDFVEGINQGKLIFVNAPEGQFGTISKLIGLQFLLQYQRAVLKRMDSQVTINRERLCFIILDEVQKFMCQELANFASVSRQARACTIALHQDLGQIPDEYKASFLANIRTKIVLNVNDYYTADYFSKFFGEHEVDRVTKTAGRSSGGQGADVLFGATHSNRSTSLSTQREPRFYPQDLIQLPKNRAVLSFFNGDQVEESRVIELLPYYLQSNNLFPERETRKHSHSEKRLATRVQ